MRPLLIEACGLVAGHSGPVVGPLSLALARGEVLGVAGPNGCGKSTLLATLAGSLRRWSGTLWSAPGIRVSLQTQRQPTIAGVPLAGGEFLALTGAGSDGLPAWLADCLRQRVDRLSGGQRQLLYLSACLYAPADLVLLDEPTNNLDPAGTDHLAGAVRARAASGAGLVVVSHDERFLRAVCDRRLDLGGNDDA